MAELFKKGGVEAIRNGVKPARSKLSAEQQALIIKSWVLNDSSFTIKAIKIQIQEKFDINLEKSSVHRMLKKLGFSHITGRKKHYKSSDSEQTEFKKNLNEISKESPEKAIFSLTKQGLARTLSMG